MYIPTIPRDFQYGFLNTVLHIEEALPGDIFAETWYTS